MSHKIELSDEELAELDELLSESLKETLSELHHTDSRAYRDYVKHTLSLIEKLLKIPDSHLNGPSGDGRLVSNVSISFRYIEGEGLLMLLDLAKGHTRSEN